jgi:GNAT superfamily N-acetyltransferase
LPEPADARNAELVTTFRIRNAVQADLAALRDIFRRSSLSNDGDRAKLLAHPEFLELSDVAVTEGRVRAAISDGTLVGFATWLASADAVELEDLFVDPDQMRRGAGQALVRDVAAIARSRGAVRVEVTGNPDARAFYAKVGFVADDYVQTTFGPGIRMHLDLGQDHHVHNADL